MEKVCNNCEEVFTPKRKDATYCYKKVCRSARSRIITQQYRRRKAVEEGREDRVDIGRGGGQKKGEDSPFYKNGIRYFHAEAGKVKDERRYCERCNEDLIDADRWHWCVHHIDHDRTNNKRDNFELLCKRCHQLEHECWKAFEGSTTIP